MTPPVMEYRGRSQIIVHVGMSVLFAGNYSWWLVHDPAKRFDVALANQEVDPGHVQEVVDSNYPTALDLLHASHGSLEPSLVEPDVICSGEDVRLCGGPVASIDPLGPRTPVILNQRHWERSGSLCALTSGKNDDSVVRGSLGYVLDQRSEEVGPHKWDQDGYLAHRLDTALVSWFNEVMAKIATISHFNRGAAWMTFRYEFDNGDVLTNNSVVWNLNGQWIASDDALAMVGSIDRESAEKTHESDWQEEM